MRPEDIIDGLGQVSDRMVLDAQNLKKTPRRSLKWGSLAACILCGVVLLGVCAVKLRNSDRQQSLDTPEPSVRPAVSEIPQDSVESQEESVEAVQPRALEQAEVHVNDYQVVVREDAVYFVDPYIGLMSMNPETEETKTILPNGSCSLAESDGSLYCLSRATRQVDLVENGDVTTLVTLEDVGPGYPILLGVSNGYVCWRQNSIIYAASIDDGAARIILPYSGETGEYLNCGVYQGAVYTVNEQSKQFYRTELNSGETTELSAEMLSAQDGITVKTDEDRIYVIGKLESGEITNAACFYNDPQWGSIEELPVEVQDGILFQKNQVHHEDGTESDIFIFYNVETGETTTLLDETQTAAMGGVWNWWIAPSGIYYTRMNAGGLYYYDFGAKTDQKVYQSSGLYGNLVMEPDFYWQQADSYAVGAWYEHLNERKDYYDLTATETGIYYVNPGEGVYRYIPEEEQIEQLISGKACRILNCDEGLYATCSDSGEVYEIKDGTAELIATLEKETQIAIKPIAVTNGKLYWNYFVTDLSTGETQIDPIFRLKKSQPQIMHQGKIYCLGGNGEIGYVDPTGGTENYVPLTQALGTSEDDWAVRFFDDSAIALQKTEDGTGFDIYQISYEDGNTKWLGAVEGETVSILNLEGDILYLEPMQEMLPTGIVAMNITTGETNVMMEENPLMFGMEVQVWRGTCYYVWREHVLEFHAYDLEDGTDTAYVPEDSIISQ